MINLSVLNTGIGFAVCRIIDDTRGPIAAFMGPTWAHVEHANLFKEEIGQLYIQTQTELIENPRSWKATREMNRHTIRYRTTMKLLADQDEVQWVHEIDLLALIVTFLAGVYVHAEIPPADVVEGKVALAQSFV